MVAWIPVLLTGMLTIAAEPGPAGPRGHQMRGGQDISGLVDEVIAAVEATPEQTEKLKAIAAEHEAATTAARQKTAALSDEQRTQLKSLREEARAARRAGNTEEVDKLQAQIQELAGTNPAELVKSTHQKIAAVLTAEQLPAYREVVAAHNQQRGPGNGRGGRGGPEERGQGFMLQRFIDRVIEEVDATDEQQTQLEAIAKEHALAAKEAREKAQAARTAITDKLDELREELHAAMKDGDEEKTATLRTQMRELMGVPERDAMIQTTLDKIGKVLTAEQKPAYDALVAEMKERLAAGPQEFRGPRGGRGGRDGRGPGGDGPHGPRGERPDQPDGDEE